MTLGSIYSACSFQKITLEAKNSAFGTRVNTGSRQNSYFYDEVSESAVHLTILVYRYTEGTQFLITVKKNAIEADTSILSTKTNYRI